MHVKATIGGMDCGGCATKIERVVGHLPEVESVDVDLTFSTLRAETSTDVGDRIRATVEELGYTYSSIEAVRPTLPTRPPLHHDTHFIAVLVGLVTTVAAVAMTYGFGQPLAGTMLYGVAVLSGGYYVFGNAIGSLRHGHLDINVLMTIAVAGAIGLGEWFEAATVVVLFAFAEWLEGLSMERARGAIRELMELAPAVARLVEGDEEREVPVEQVMVGEMLSVRPGERIPLDGVVTRGMGAVDESPITGESQPVAKEPGDSVYAGSMNDQGHLTVEVTAPPSESTIAHVIRAIESAQANRAESERFIERFTRWYTPVVVLIAVLVAVIPPLFVGGWEEWFYRALVLLVISCPCALVIATPITTVSALARSARDGVLIKGGAYLEALAGLKAVVFDKTGTLTKAELSVVDIVAFESSTDEVLAVAAAAERRSEHHLARAIVRFAKERGLDIADAGNFTAHPGRGIEAYLGVNSCGSSCESARSTADRILVGAHRLFEAEGIDVEADAEAWRTLQAKGATVVGVMRGEQLLGLIACRDTVREGAAEVLTELRQLGIDDITMCTGDNAEVARQVADAVGIAPDRVHPSLLPADKVAVLLATRERVGGAVAMVGDGINDAPALAAADIGIAMGAAGTDIALETAHVALMGDDLSRLPQTVRLARRSVQTIWQNVALALVIKLVVLGMAVAGYASIWLAIAADMGTSLLVIANAMKLQRK